MMKKVGNNYQCINVSNETYTGKEMSPKGIGFSALGYEIGFEKEGVDKQLWVVQLKNNKKVWFRKNGMPKVVHEEPLITSIDTLNIKDDTKDMNNIITIVDNKDDINDINNDIINDNNDINGNNYNIASKLLVNKDKQEKSGANSKKTDFSIFYKYYSNKLKEENKQNGIMKKPKEVQEETYSEWNRIKKNKEELNELLLLINNKT